MEVSQIHNLELLIETISNLIDLYKANTNQTQNSYQPNNLCVRSKRTAAEISTNSQRSTASNLNLAPTQKKTNDVSDGNISLRSATPSHIESAQSPYPCREKNMHENSHAALPENKERNPEPKKTYASALVDDKRAAPIEQRNEWLL